MEDLKQILSNKVNRSQIIPGDHIYTWRTAWLYAHHGIYVGDEKVIHFTCGGGTGTVVDRIIRRQSPSSKPCSKCGDQSNAKGVIISCLDCFLSGYNLFVYRYGVSPVFFLAQARGGTCTLAFPDPPDDAICRATFLLEKGFNIFKHNSEDFAIYCKTGLMVFNTVGPGRSGQAATCCAAGTAVLVTRFRGLAPFHHLALAGLAFFCMHRLGEDYGMRCDVKISAQALLGLLESVEKLEEAQIPEEPMQGGRCDQ